MKCFGTDIKKFSSTKLKTKDYEYSINNEEYGDENGKIALQFFIIYS